MAAAFRPHCMLEAKPSPAGTDGAASGVHGLLATNLVPAPTKAAHSKLPDDRI